MGNGKDKDTPDVKTPKGKPDGGGAKATVDTVIPVTIKPTKAEFVVVLDKTGAVPATFPILSFDVTGPPGWFYEVQVSRKDSTKFTEGPGLTGSWDKSKDPKDRVPQATFSSWTNGEKTLKLDGAGKAKYEMPLDWWKDQARQKRKDFKDQDYFYRALGFKDASGAAPRFSTPNATPKGKKPPSVKVHNNLVDFKLTDLGFTAGGLNKKERVDFTVREANTTGMYTIVQWLTGSNRVWGGANTYAAALHYGITHRLNYSELTIDSSVTNPRPNFFGGASGPSVSADGKTATGTDPPGGAIGGSDTTDFMSVDFETRVHLNFEVPSTVKIKTQTGSAPVYDTLIGVLDDPQPFILDAGTWNVRILQVKKADGSVTVTHPDTYP